MLGLGIHGCEIDSLFFFRPLKESGKILIDFLNYVLNSIVIPETEHRIMSSKTKCVR